MKIEYKMIDWQLRVPGRIFKMFMKSSSEADFRQLRKKSDNMRGKKVKGLNCSEEWITSRKDGTVLRICIYRPLVSLGNAAGILWMHGGGYAMGVPESSIGLISKLIAESGCVVVAPDYSKEYRFSSIEGSKLSDFQVSKDSFSATIEKRGIRLTLKVKQTNPVDLVSPERGEMKSYIKESLEGSLELTLKIINQPVVNLTSQRASIDIHFH